MAMNRAVFLIILLLGYAFPESTVAESSTSIQAEATVEIQYDGLVGSSIILMTSHPASGTTSVASNSSTITLSTSTTLLVSGSRTTVVQASSSSSALFNTPLLFGTSRTQMINATSTGQYLFPAATGSSQMTTGTTASHSLLQSTTPIPNASLVAGSGTRRDITWSYVFF